VTNDSDVITKASDIRTLGIVGDSKRRTAKQRSWSFDIVEQGYRYHMSDINAAMGVVQLKKFPSFQKKRKTLAKNYDAIFSKSPFIEVFKRNYNEITPHIYAVRLSNRDSRAELQKYLLSQGIQTGYHYFPNHLLTFFKKKGQILPVVEDIFPSLLTLPSHVGVTKKDVLYIAKEIDSFYS
jgi:dTDP-4-amino-4,6-dideoxygalactose transaminase